MACHIKTGDTVIVTAGNDRGSVGEVLSIYLKRWTCIVKGVNIRKKHVKPTQQNQQGGIIRMEMPLHMSNVSPCVGGKPSRVRFEVGENGSKSRIAVRDGSELHQLRGGGKPGGEKTAKKTTKKTTKKSTKKAPKASTKKTAKKASKKTKKKKAASKAE